MTPPEPRRDAAMKKADAERRARQDYLSVARERLMLADRELSSCTHSTEDKQVRYARAVADKLDELAELLRAGAAVQEAEGTTE